MGPSADLCTACTRRDFLIRAAVPVVAGCLACSTPMEPHVPEQPFAEVSSGEIRIRLALVPEFSRDNSYLVIYVANVIAIHLTGDDYRAFTNICTHAGCGITLFLEGRFRCQCHGSEYDVVGSNVAGPAPLPLKRYQVTVDSITATVTIDLR